MDEINNALTAESGKCLNCPKLSESRALSVAVWYSVFVRGVPETFLDPNHGAICYVQGVQHVLLSLKCSGIGAQL